MGKIRTREIGIADVEQKQKKDQKERSLEKKKTRSSGAKHVEGVISSQVGEENIAKMEKAQKIIQRKEKLPEKKEQAKKISVRGAQYIKSKKLLDNKKSYPIKEAIKLLKKIKYSRFDESVELHLNVDEAGLKGDVDLPHSTGKMIRVKVVDEALIEDIAKGKMDFDVLVTHPSFMPKLAKFAKVLGPKGLMPNPKSGTISTNPQELVAKYAKGVLRFKTESKFPLIHQMIGKISMDEKALFENAKTFIQAVGSQHIVKTVIKTTMSPAIKVDIEKI